MTGRRSGEFWGDVSKTVDNSDARIRAELVWEIDNVINTIEAVSGHRFDLEEAVRRYVCKAGPIPNLDEERDAILIHVVCNWLFALTEGCGLLCKTIDWEDLPTWVQGWYNRANACDLVWLRRGPPND